MTTSKEALEILYSIACIEAGQKQQYITYAKEIEHNEKVKKLYDLIKQDLERLETLEQTNNALVYELEKEDLEYQKMKNLYFDSMRENEKLKKVIEIIKTANVNTDFLIKSLNVEQYNKWCDVDQLHLTQQEYELLKEVLK